jgi:soluble lytic murein transglycosylase-like protein
MHKSLFVAAALAAGATAFALGTEEGNAASLKTHHAARHQAAKSEKAAGCRTLVECFSTNSAAKIRAKAGMAATGGKHRRKAFVAADGSTKSRGKTYRHKKTEAYPVDRIKTASIAAEAVSLSGSGAYSAIIARYAASYGVPVSLARAVVGIESNYNPNKTGSAGEVGLMQIKPATARMMGYAGSVRALYDPETNIRFGMKYLAMAQGLGGGTTCGTILKYNAGHGATRMNPISSAYCRRVKVEMASAGSPA